MLMIQYITAFKFQFIEQFEFYFVIGCRGGSLTLPHNNIYPFR